MATKQERRSAAASRRKSPAKPGQPAKAAKAPANPQQVDPKTKPGPRSGQGADGLTDQQRKFYLAYRVHRNGTKAAIESGYSPASAAVTACRMLKNPKLRALIEADEQETKAAHAAEVAQVSEDYDISPRRILREMARIAFFDPRKVSGPNGEAKSLHELDDDTAAAIAGIDIQELWGGSGDERTVIGLVKKWKASDKLKALEMLAKHKGLFALDNEGKVQPFAEALAGFFGQLHSSGGSRIPIRPAKGKA